MRTVSRRVLVGIGTGLLAAAFALLPAREASADRVCASLYYWAFGSGPHTVVDDCYGPDPGWGSDSAGFEVGDSGVVRIGVGVQLPAPV